MTVSESEINRIISVVRMNCAQSGGCSVFVNKDDNLTCVMGDKEICYITQEEGRNAETVRQKIKDALT